MGRLSNVVEAVVEQNGAKRFVAKITVGVAGALTALPTTYPGGALIEPGSTFVFQPDQDMYLLLQAASVGASVVTTHAGSNPGTRVLQYQQEFQTPNGQTQIDAISTVAGTNLSVFTVK